MTPSRKDPVYVTQPHLPPLDEFIPYLEKIWASKTLTNGGPFHQELEQALCDYLGVRHLALFTNGTLALVTALQALRITGEVITTPYSFVATSHSLLWNGIKPVFADVDPVTLNLDPARIEAAITPRTKGIIPVHLTGLPAPMEAIWKIAEAHGLWVVEDAAQAMGARYRGRKIGADPRSVFTVYSFHPNKNMTTGEGGAIVCHDDRFLDRIRRLRFHGIERDAWKRFQKEGSPHFDVMEPARKANFMDLQAAMGLHQIKKLDGFNARRKQLFLRYLELMKDIGEVMLPVPGDAAHGHCHHLFVLRLHPEKAGMDRDTFVARLKDENIGTGIHYRPAHVHSFYRDYYQQRSHALPKDGLPHTEWSGDRLMSLPLWPGLTEADQDQVVATIRQVLATPGKK